MCEEVRDEDLTAAQRRLAKDLDAIGEAEQHLDEERYAFLKTRGWEYTCRIGALWLWRKGTLAVSMDTAINLESRYPDGITGLDNPEHLRLVAAAPDLLAALTAVEKEISSRFASDLDMSDELRAVMIQARVAIAKTEPSLLEELQAK